VFGAGLAIKAVGIGDQITNRNPIINRRERHEPEPFSRHNLTSAGLMIRRQTARTIRRLVGIQLADL
jgi:hypothetical protein